MSNTNEIIPIQQIDEQHIKIEKRRKEIWNLFLQGFTQEQIAEKFKVSIKTISRDFKELKKESVQWMEALPKGEIQTYYRSIFETLERIIQELWKMYDDTEDNKLKITILNSIAQKRKHLVDVMNPKIMLELRAKIYDEIRDPYSYEDAMYRQRPKIDYGAL